MRCWSTPPAGRSRTPTRCWPSCGSGRLRAALDVTDPEPLPAEHPLWDAPGLLLTPHVGGAVSGFPRRAYALVREQLGRWARDEPLENVVRDGY